MGRTPSRSRRSSCLLYTSPSEQALALQSFETFAKVADGKATKIIIPSELQSMAGFATSMKEFFTDGKQS